MNKGMLISCGGCGYTRHICLDGDFDAREQQLIETLRAGWRYTTTGVPGSGLGGGNAGSGF